MKLKFSRMTLFDIPEVMALELESFTSPWSEGMFREEMEQELSYTLLARTDEAQLVGFICFRVIVDEMEIMNIAVREDLRGRGIGRRLVKRALNFGKARGARAATLEVRQSNGAAINLYQGLGFEVAGKRRNYYDSPRENAVIMWLYNIDKSGSKSP